MTDAKANVCPECGAQLPPEAVLCVSCGLHLATGKKIGSDMPPASKEKPKASGKKAEKSGKKSSLPIIVTVVAVLILAAGGFLVFRSMNSAKPTASSPETTGEAVELNPEAEVALEEGPLRVTGPQFAADAVFTGITSSTLWTTLSPQLSSVSPPKTLTIAIVTPPSGTTAAAGTTIATLRAEVRIKPTGAPAYRRDFVGTAVGSVDTDPEVLLNAKRAAAAEMAADLPARLGATALGMVGKPALVLPQVQQWLVGTDADLQRVACLYFAKSPTQPKVVLPSVVPLLASADARLRSDALDTLTAYGPRAAPYSAAILASLQNTDPETRDKALALVDTLRLQISSSGGKEVTWLEAQFIPDGTTPAPAAKPSTKPGKKGGSKKKNDGPDEDDLATLVEGFDQPKGPPAKIHVQGLGKVIQILLYVM